MCTGAQGLVDKIGDGVPRNRRAPLGLTLGEGTLAATSPQTSWPKGEQTPRFAW